MGVGTRMTAMNSRSFGPPPVTALIGKTQDDAFFLSHKRIIIVRDAQISSLLICKRCFVVVPLLTISAKKRKRKIYIHICVYIFVVALRNSTGIVDAHTPALVEVFIVPKTAPFAYYSAHCAYIPHVLSCEYALVMSYLDSSYEPMIN